MWVWWRVLVNSALVGLDLLRSGDARSGGAVGGISDFKFEISERLEWTC